MLTLWRVCPGAVKTSSDRELLPSYVVQPTDQSLMLTDSQLTDPAHDYSKIGSDKLMSSVHSVVPRDC